MRAIRRRTVERASAVVAVLALAATGTAVALTTDTASASRLEVTATGPASLDRTACASAAVVASSVQSGASTTQVKVTGPGGADLPAACTGLPIRVAVAPSTGAPLADTTVTVVGGTVTVPTSFTTASADKAAVVVGGFAVPTSWQAPAPAVTCEVWAGGVNTGRSCDIDVWVASVDTSWVDHRQAYLDYRLSASLSYPDYAVLHIDFEQVPPGGSHPSVVGFSWAGWNWSTSIIQRNLANPLACQLPLATLKTDSPTSLEGQLLSVHEGATWSGACPG